MCKITVSLCFIAIHLLLFLGWRVTRSSDLLLHFGLFEIQIHTAIQCCIDLYRVCQATAARFLTVPTQTKCLPVHMEAATALSSLTKIHFHSGIQFISLFFFLP